MPADARTELAQLVDTHGDDLPLDVGAALLASEECPGAAVADVQLRLDELARGVCIPEDRPLFERLARLNHFLFVDQGFRGDIDRYDAPCNSCLDEVLSRRKGLPILLSLVTMEVGRRVGIEFYGIGFPGHFIVSPKEADPRFFVDPFHGGRILREDALRTRLKAQEPSLCGDRTLWESFLAPVSHRAILVRMNHNLKASYIRRRDGEAALRAVQRLRILEPEQPQHLRDEGLLLADLDRHEEAVEALEAHLALSPFSSQAEVLLQLLGQLKAGA